MTLYVCFIVYDKNVYDRYGQSLEKYLHKSLSNEFTDETALFSSIPETEINDRMLKLT